MVSLTLASLYTVFGLKLGCSGAAALIGDKVLYNGRFSVLTSVHLSIPPLKGPRASQAGLRPSQSRLRARQASEAWLAGSKACLAGSEA